MAGQPNMLLVILDALRDDALDSPFVEPGRCYRAATAMATAPWTLPSCSSIMTGRDSVRHGHYWFKPPMGGNPLLDALPHNYRKVGLVNNAAIGSGSSVEHGFDQWKLSIDHDESFERALRVIKRAKRRRPYFIVLHSNIVHDYFRPVADRYLPPGHTESAHLGPRVVSWRDSSPAEQASTVAAYAACTAALVERVDSVLDAVRQRDDFVTVITADHGEGFDPEGGRVHHGGRLHQDLLRVPAFFDLPSSIPVDRRSRLSDALGSQVLFGTDVLPTLFDVAGHTDLPTTDGASLLANAPRTLVSEDRHYLYLKDRFRLNYHGKYKNMSDEEIEHNQRISETLAEPPCVRSFVRYPEKCIVTSLCLQSDGEGVPGRTALADLGESLLGSPAVVANRDRLFAFERFDLSSDPLERHNLLLETPEGATSLLGTPWEAAIAMPAEGRDDIGLADMLDGGEQLGPAKA
jgi:arylsulfatase A-like enzyme